MIGKHGKIETWGKTRKTRVTKLYA
eukprot:SAG11_NODE_23850_length_382_cov_0.893993_1_plen_24_part_10